jgi:hypothetical protein
MKTFEFFTCVDGGFDLRLGGDEWDKVRSLFIERICLAKQREKCQKAKKCLGYFFGSKTPEKDAIVYYKKCKRFAISKGK